jgi:hypothetical protein
MNGHPLWQNAARESYRVEAQVRLFQLCSSPDLAGIKRLWPEEDYSVAGRSGMRYRTPQSLS